MKSDDDRWRLAVEASGDALWDWTLDTGMINISPSFRAITGWPDGAALRGNDIWPERIHPEDLRKAMAACEKAQDFVTRDLLGVQLEDTEMDHAYFLEKQLRLIELIGLQNYIQSQM